MWNTIFTEKWEHVPYMQEGVPTVVIRDGKGNPRAPRARGCPISGLPYLQNLGFLRFFQAASTRAAAVAPRIRYLSKLVIP